MPAYFPSRLALMYKSDPAWVSKLTSIERLVLPYHFDFMLRDDQRIPEFGRYCFFIGGRGFGKTWAVAVEIQKRVARGEVRNLALVGPTEPRTHEVLVKTLIETSPPWFKAIEDKGGVLWPNGARAYVYTAEAPEVRGPNFDHAWLTELVQWPAGTRREVFNNVTTATRVGRAQVFADTTSKGKNELILDLLKFHEQDPKFCALMRGTIWDNEWYDYEYLRGELRKYPPGRRRDEELDGKVFTEAAGALWQDVWIDRARRPFAPPHRIRLVSIDPATTTGKDSDVCGFVVGELGSDGDVYVTHDRSDHYKPHHWGDMVIDEHAAGATGVVIEVTGNSGGDYLIANIRARAERQALMGKPAVSVREWPESNGQQFPEYTRGVVYVREAKARDNKETRAYPAASLTEQGRVHLVGAMAELETEMTQWVPGDTKSPNRLDAAARLITELSGIVRDTADTKAAAGDATRAHEQLRGALRAASRGQRVGM